MNKSLIIHPRDNVAVALADLKKGEKVMLGERSIAIVHDIPAKHKFLLESRSSGEPIYMYGLIVGKATKPIAQGEAISTQNIVHQSEAFDKDKRVFADWQPPDVSKWQDRAFLGYHRSDGQVGTRNYWLVFPLVFCENRNIVTLQRAFDKALGFEKKSAQETMVSNLVTQFKSGTLNVDEVKSFDTAYSDLSDHTPVFENVELRFITHQMGCGGTRQDATALCRLLAGYIKNPNVAGATVLSLGCQNAEDKLLFDRLKELDCDKPVELIEQQTEGSEQQLMQRAITKTFARLIECNKITRTPAPLSRLTVGLECGGSDGFSGISANPATGYFSDLLAALGGKTMLSEFPELCGVEQELMNRIKDDKSAEKFELLMRSYESAAQASGSGFDMNPSPGNIKDGLITDAIKSAGAAKKGGTSPINGVLDYTEYAENGGLNLLCTPGNDVESTTALTGSGANLILFTTGLGTPTGNPACPVLKISSNTKLAQKMPDIIDFNTGDIISGEKSIEEKGEELLEYVIRIASGEQTKAEQLRQFDFIPWKRGVSL